MFNINVKLVALIESDNKIIIYPDIHMLKTYNITPHIS